VEKSPGDRVVGATINQTGSLIIVAERVGADSLLAQIVTLVAQAQRSRAPLQRLADEVTKWFVPAVMATAVVTFIDWWFAGPECLRSATTRSAFRSRPGCSTQSSAGF